MRAGCRARAQDSDGRRLRGGLLTSLEVIELYGVASVQGEPRFGLRQFGVPPGGAFDQGSLAAANALMGNEPTAPAIELAMASCRLRASARMALAIAGANAGAVLDGTPLDSNLFELGPGSELSLMPPTVGARAYLSVAGGWAEEAGLALKPGSVLRARGSRGGHAVARKPTSLSSPATLRVIVRDQDYPDIEQLFGPDFTVSLRSDRVGIRLEGLSMASPQERLSEPVCMGAIQAARDGTLLALGPDGPTVGGYPVVAVVCSADLDRLGQLRPFEIVRFERIDRGQAVRAWLAVKQAHGRAAK